MQPPIRRRPRWRPLTVLLVSAALVVSACAGGDDDDASTGGDDDTTATTVDAAAVLGDENPADGEPITIGYVYDGESDTVDYSGEREAVEAVVEYANTYLGGVAGRPIELDVCETGATPAGAADCVTQMVADGVPAVVNGVTTQPAALYPPLAAEGIPVFTTGALDRESLSAPGIYLLGNVFLTVLAGPAQVAADNDIAQAAIMVVDNPAASGQLETAAPTFYGNVDVGVDVVTIPIDTPDVTPQVTAALGDEPGLIQVIGDPPFCGKVMRALDTVGYDGEIVVIPACLQGGANTDLPNLEGSLVLGNSSTDPEADEVKLYNAVLDTYASEDLDRGNVAVTGYQAMLGFVRAVAGLEGDVTADSVKATIEGMEPTPLPLADGVMFQCNHTAVAVAPNICSSDVLQTRLDAEGQGTTYEVLDGTEVLTMG